MKIVRFLKKFSPYIGLLLVSYLFLMMTSIFMKNLISNPNEQKSFKKFFFDNLNHKLYGQWSKEISSESNLLENQFGNAEIIFFGDSKEFMESKFVKGINSLKFFLTEKKQITINNA